MAKLNTHVLPVPALHVDRPRSGASPAVNPPNRREFNRGPPRALAKSPIRCDTVTSRHGWQPLDRSGNKTRVGLSGPCGAQVRPPDQLIVHPAPPPDAWPRQGAYLFDHQLVFGRSALRSRSQFAGPSTGFTHHDGRLRTSSNEVSPPLGARPVAGRRRCSSWVADGRRGSRRARACITSNKNWPDIRPKSLRDGQTTGRILTGNHSGKRGEWVELWGSRWGVMAWRYR